MIVDLHPTAGAIYIAIWFVAAVLFVLSFAARETSDGDLATLVLVAIAFGGIWPLALPGLMLWGIAKLVNKRAQREKDRQIREHEELLKAYNDLLSKHRALEEQLARERAEGKYR